MTVKRKKTLKTKTEKSMTTKKTKKAKTPLVITTGKMTIGPFRGAFMHKVLQLAGKEGQSKTCSCAILLPKDDKKIVRKVKETIRWTAREKFGEKADPLNRDSKLKHSLQNGDALYEDDDSSVGAEGEGHYVLSAKAWDLPKIVNRKLKRITGDTDLKEYCASGNFFNFVIVFKAYEFKMEEGGVAKGVRCEIKHIQFVEEGERIDGSTKPEDEFEALDDVDDEDDEIDFEDDDD